MDDQINTSQEEIETALSHLQAVFDLATDDSCESDDPTEDDQPLGKLFNEWPQVKSLVRTALGELSSSGHWMEVRSSLEEAAYEKRHLSVSQGQGPDSPSSRREYESLMRRIRSYARDIEKDARSLCTNVDRLDTELFQYDKPTDELRHALEPAPEHESDEDVHRRPRYWLWNEIDQFREVFPRILRMAEAAHAVAAAEPTIETDSEPSLGPGRRPRQRYRDAMMLMRTLLSRPGRSQRQTDRLVSAVLFSAGLQSNYDPLHIRGFLSTDTTGSPRQG